MVNRGTVMCTDHRPLEANVRASATCHYRDNIEQSLDHMHQALAELDQQLERVLRAELAKLAPHERRLFRAELAPTTQYLQANPAQPHLVDVVVECDPPRVWLVAPGSPEDDLTTEQATMLVKAGAGACRFDSDGDCAVALCDACHPEEWAGRTDTVVA